MAHAITLPKLGLTMEEGTITEWYHADGDQVKKGRPLFAVETDKIVSDIDADADGFLQCVAPLNQLLPVGALVGYLHESAAASKSAGPLPSLASAIASSEPESSAISTYSAVPPRLSDRGGTRIRVSPVARRLAAEHDIHLRSVVGSGRHGVILKRDVLRSVTAVAAPMRPSTMAPSPPETSPSLQEPRRRPMSRLRRVVAQRMMKSLAGSAQMTGFGKVDMTEAVRIRQELVAAADRLGARITITDLALKAAATVLVEMPEINSSIDGDDIITWNDVHLGLAVAIDDGLVVPVIRNVDRLSLAELAAARVALIEKARSGRLSAFEIEGATFTLSNFGSYGGDFETPILSPPQSALLGIGQITDEPVVRNGAIVVRSMMTISLTFDHRLIDGAVAGRFRARFRSLLEVPALWMATLR